MFKAKLNKEQKDVLFELLKLLSEVDGNISYDEMELIKEWKKTYGYENYAYQEFKEERIRGYFLDFDEEDRVNILTHGILLAMVDDIFSRDQKSIIKSFFDILTPESVEKIQELIDSHGAYDFNVKEFVYNDKDDNVIKHEAIKLMNKFSRKKKAKDIDEKKLFNMNKGQIVKVWSKVLNLWEIVKNPKSDLTIKAMAVGALAYLILPLDVIPDFIPIAGLADDAGVILYAVTQISKFMKTKDKQ